MTENAEVEWRRSSYCANADCVEVAFVDAHVLVRDSKDPDGPMLRLASADWKAFLENVRSGNFGRRPAQGVEST